MSYKVLSHSEFLAWKLQLDGSCRLETSNWETGGKPASSAAMKADSDREIMRKDVENHWRPRQRVVAGVQQPVRVEAAEASA